MVNLVGGLYPALYDYLVEVPVEPTIPPGSCITSGIKSRCLVEADLSECVEVFVKTDGVTVQVMDYALCTRVLACECEVRVRDLVTMDCVTVRQLVTADIKFCCAGKKVLV